MQLCLLFELVDGLVELHDLVLDYAECLGEFPDDDGLLCSEVVLRHGDSVMRAEVCGEDEVLFCAAECSARCEVAWVDVLGAEREQAARACGADGVDFLLRMCPAYLRVRGSNGADERVKR